MKIVETFVSNNKDTKAIEDIRSVIGFDCFVVLKMAQVSEMEPIDSW